MIESTHPHEGPGRFLSRKEAAEFLGIGIRKLDAYRADRTSGIPETWHGGRVTFQIDALCRWAQDLGENGRHGPKSRHPQRR